MKYFLIFSLIFPLCSLLGWGGLFKSSSTPVDRYVTQISKKICKKYRLSVCQRGGAQDKPDSGVRLINIGFAYYGEPIMIDQARKLIVTIAEEFLTKINANETLRPYLKNYPFTIHNMSIALYCYDFRGNEINHPYLNTVHNVKNQIGYMTQDPENHYKFKEKIYRPYEEELAIVKADPSDKCPPFDR